MINRDVWIRTRESVSVTQKMAVRLLPGTTFTATATPLALRTRSPDYVPSSFPFPGATAIPLRVTFYDNAITVTFPFGETSTAEDTAENPSLYRYTVYATPPGRSRRLVMRGTVRVRFTEPAPLEIEIKSPFPKYSEVVNTTITKAQKAYIYWDLPAGLPAGTTVTGYKLTISYPSGTTQTVSTTASSYTITDLAQKTDYSVTLSAITNTYGEAKPSAALVFTTNATDLPPAVAVSGKKISWTAPEVTPRPVDYAVRYTLKDGRTILSKISALLGRLATEYTFTMPNGEQYDVQVAAISSLGTLSYSTAAKVGASGPPAAIAFTQQALVGTVPTFAWSAPTNNGGSAILSYSVDVMRRTAGTYSFQSASQASLPANTTAYAIHNAAVGDTYYLNVRAVNALGVAEYPTTSQQVLVATQPTPPRNLSLVPSDGTIDVSWQTPESLGGGAFSWYQISCEPTDSSSAATVSYIRNQGTTKTTISGLTNGKTYSVSVVAVTNISATVQQPSTSNSVSGTAIVQPRPSVPSNVTVTPSSSQLSISWQPPSAGATGYKVYITRVSTGAVVVRTQSATSLSETGLVNGETYSVQVSAVNESGEGDKSPAVVKAVGAVPGAPASLVAVSGAKSLIVAWTAPSFTAPITGYDVLYQNQGDLAQSVASTTGTALTLTGLAAAASYSVSVRAISSVGPGPYSASVTGTTSSVLAAPTQVSAIPNGFGSATVSWTPPYAPSDQPVIRYWVKVDGVAQNAGTSTSLYASGFTGGHRTLHTVSVAAETASGIGAYSTPISVPGDIAASPSGFAVTAGNGSASLAWPVQQNDGVEVLGYVVSYLKSGDSVETKLTLPASATSQQVTGLENGKLYNFWLQIVDRAGVGSRVNSGVAVTPIGVPDAPTGISPIARPKGMALSWTEPKSNSNLSVTQYTIEYTPAGGPAGTILSAGSTPSIGLYAKLPSGSPLYPPAVNILASTVYTIRVAATNDVGTGPWSAPVTVTTLAAAPPSAPRGVTAVSSIGLYGAIELEWSPPLDPGTADVRGYVLNVAEAGSTAADIVISSPSSQPNGRVVYTATGLTNGVSYNISVAAYSDDGTGATVSASAVPGGGYGVRSLAAAAGDRRVDVSWVAPQLNASGLTYSVQVAQSFNPGGSTGLSTSLPGFVEYTTQNLSYAVTSLSNGKPYAIGVAPKRDGALVASYQYKVAIPVGVPQQPVGFTATPTKSGMQLSWKEPPDDYGKLYVPLLKYNLTIWDGTANSYSTLSPQNTSYLHSGLTPNAAYWYEITSENEKGVSTRAQIAQKAWSIPPGPVRALSASVNNRYIYASWLPPADEGLESVYRYALTLSIGGRSASLLAEAPSTAYLFSYLPAGLESASQSNTTLSSGTYTISVKAINSSGPGPSVSTTATIN